MGTFEGDDRKESHQDAGLGRFLAVPNLKRGHRLSCYVEALFEIRLHGRSISAARFSLEWSETDIEENSSRLMFGSKISV